MGGIAEVSGKGKGQPRDPKKGKMPFTYGQVSTPFGGQMFGEAAQQRAGSGEFAAYGRAAQAIAKPFGGVVDYLKHTMGGGEDKSKSAVDRLTDHMGGDSDGIKRAAANKLRGARQTARKHLGGVYYKGHTPDNEKHADLQSELWRRVPKPLKTLYRRGNPEHGKKLDHIQELEDRSERKSSLDRFKQWSDNLQQEIDNRPSISNKK